MRLRNVKNKEEIMNNAVNLITDPKSNRSSWHKVFGNNNPIYVEIGMGKGDFIIANALKYPNINFIGIEKFDSVIVRALAKVPLEIPNLKFIRMDAKEIDEVFDYEIDRLYLNFSDPWPKKRHHDRRLTSHIFLSKYDNLFRNDIEIHQKTDNRDLFEYSLISLSTYGYVLEDVSLDYHHSNYEDIIMTEYEKKFVAKGENIYYLVAKKVTNRVKKC